MSLCGHVDGIAHQERAVRFRQVLNRKLGDYIDSHLGCGARGVSG